jgi:maltokinase
MPVSNCVDDRRFREWFIAQRWFGSKARRVRQLGIVDEITLRADAPSLALMLIGVGFREGVEEIYQVPLAMRPQGEGTTEGVVCTIGDWAVFDGLADPGCRRELLHCLRPGSEVLARDGGVTFTWAGSPDGAFGDVMDIRPLGEEQSNTSVVLDEKMVLKVFRRIEQGVNPELEMLEFLSKRDFKHIAPLVGWYALTGRAMPGVTVAVVQEYLAGACNGWKLAVEQIVAHPIAGFLDQVAALGEVVGSLHAQLGSDSGDPVFAPEEMDEATLARLVADVDRQIDWTFRRLPRDNMDTAPVAGHGRRIREILMSGAHGGAGGRVIRTHGDLHLGQTLRTDRGWMLLDFEGEPARPVPERRRKHSPLRDVAGMLRSFSYARGAALLQHGVPVSEEWESLARSAFLEGYFSTADPGLLPPDPEAARRLLSVFELEKLLYELRYELDHRPTWIPIPVAGMLRLLREAGNAGHATGPRPVRTAVGGSRTEC